MNNAPLLFLVVAFALVGIACVALLRGHRRPRRSRTRALQERWEHPQWPLDQEPSRGMPYGTAYRTLCETPRRTPCGAPCGTPETPETPESPKTPETPDDAHHKCVLSATTHKCTDPPRSKVTSGAVVPWVPTGPTGPPGPPGPPGPTGPDAVSDASFR